MKTLNVKKSLLASIIVGFSSFVATPAMAGGGFGLGLFVAGAADKPWYVGGSVGGSSLKPEVQNCCGKVKKADANSIDTGLKLYAGRNINKKLALELFYSDLGSTDIKINKKKLGSLAYKAYGAGLVYTKPITTKIKVRGKVGYGGLDSSLSGSVKHKQENSNFVYKGLGAEYLINKRFSVVADYEHFDSDLQLLSTGLRFNF